MSIAKLFKMKRKGYRTAYVDAQVDQGMATQIRVLRESRGWDQKQLAAHIGLRSQSAIARLEDPTYGKFSIATLKKLARAFDVAISVKFVSFSQLIEDTKDLSEKTLKVKSFDDEIEILQEQLTNEAVRKIFTNISANQGISSFVVPVSSITPVLSVTPIPEKNAYA